MQLNFTKGNIKGKITVETLAEHLRNGNRAALLVREYEVENNKFTTILGSLILGDETIPYEENGSLIIPTFFRRTMVPSKIGEGNPDDVVPAIAKVIKEDIIDLVLEDRTE